MNWTTLPLTLTACVWASTAVANGVGDSPPATEAPGRVTRPGVGSERAPALREAPRTFWWGDANADGHADALVSGPGAAARLFVHSGSGSFEDATVRAGLEGLHDVRLALWNDFDRDGHADLLTASPSGKSHLFRGAKDGTFSEAPAADGLALEGGVFFAEWLDWDGDGWDDLLLGAADRDHLYRNLGAGQFEEVPFDAAAAGSTVRPGAALLTTGPSSVDPHPGGGISPAGPGSPFCAPTVQDQSTGACVVVESVPSLGSLYPLGVELNIDGTGRVGIGTLTPAHQLDVAGDLGVDGQIVSTVGGSAPFVVSSTTLVSNLNADRLDGLHASAFSQLGSQIELGELASNSVNSSKIVDGSILSADIANGTITGSDIAASTITGTQIATGSILGSDIATGTITSADLGPSSVFSSEIADGSIVNVDVSSSAAIAGTKISPNFGSQDVVTTGDVGVGTSTPDVDLHVVGSSTLASVMVAPNESVSGDDSELLFAEDENGSYGIKLKYDGGFNELRFLNRSNGVDAIPAFFSMDRDNGDTQIGNSGAFQARLTVNGTDVGNLPAIQAFGGPWAGVNGSSYGTNQVGVYGSNSASTGTGVYGSGGAQGVYGQSSGTGTIGVYGYANITTSGFSRGVFGENPNTTGTSYGVRGESSSTSGRGVYGFASALTGSTYGVKGDNNSSSGYGVYAGGDMGASGTKSFVQPHPSDPSKTIRFVCLEGNESGTYFRGTADVVGGVARVPVPEEFRLVSEPDELTVQLTAVGAPAAMWIESQDLNEIVVRSNVDVTFHYMVNGIRRGFRDIELVRENFEYRPTERGVPYGNQFPEDLRQILVDNGILNPDFTVNEATAASLGWELREADADAQYHEALREGIRTELEAMEAAQRAAAADTSAPMKD